MTKRIGVAMEFPRSSKRALKWAFENLACRGDVLYLIHVNPTPDNELRRFRREQGRDIHLEISLEELRDPDIMRRHENRKSGNTQLKRKESGKPGGQSCESFYSSLGKLETKQYNSNPHPWRYYRMLVGKHVTMMFRVNVGHEDKSTGRD